MIDIFTNIKPLESKAEMGLQSKGRIIYNHNDTEIVIDTRDHTYLKNNITENSLEISNLKDWKTLQESTNTNVEQNINEINTKLDNMNNSGIVFGNWEDITLPFTATHDCFLMMSFASEANKLGYVYLQSNYAGGMYGAVDDTGRGMFTVIYPIKKGDYISIRASGDLAATPSFKLMKIIT